MDLLTVVLHEMGHVLGLPDLTSPAHAGDLMCETLVAGTRRTMTRFMVPPTTLHRPDTGPFSGISIPKDWYSDWLKELGFLI